jgi:hypothetical protein
MGKFNGLYAGTIEDDQDPSQIGRMKVRVPAVYGPVKVRVPAVTARQTNPPTLFS